mmetsp:Transcript_126631/g.394230  ORF Transcript_126631/g.394230 Transcript_126631/m.394230 type:complete len:259 (-) Transcript_126631:538-1314(-)
MAASFRKLDRLLGGLREVAHGNDREAALLDNLHALLYVGADQPDDQRLGKSDLLHGVDHAVGDDVAAHDAAEDVDEDRLDIRVALDDLERGRHCLLVGGAPHVEEVGRGAAAKIEKVHRRHGEAGPVDHAGDAAVQLDVVEVKLLGLDLLWVLLGDVPLLVNLLLAELGIVVETHLGVADDDTAVDQLGERVDLNHRAVALDEDLVERGNAGGRGGGLIALEAHLYGHVLGLLLGDPVHDVNWHLHDRCRVGRGDILN